MAARIRRARIALLGGNHGQFDPTTALSVGLKVDAEALPAAVVAGVQDGSISLTSPATTVALLKLGAVVGVVGTVETVNGTDTLTRVGITCALCHSTVDDSFAPGIGKRLDGWANDDLNPGAIIALSPALTADQKAVYNAWGPGKYDPRYNQDHLNGPVVQREVHARHPFLTPGPSRHAGPGPGACQRRAVASSSRSSGMGSFSTSSNVMRG